MTPATAPRIRYHLRVRQPRTAGQHETQWEWTPLVLDAEDVFAWVAGFAAALGQGDHLGVIERAPEDTRRVQALQIGDAQGWFTYLYPETVELRVEG